MDEETGRARLAYGTTKLDARRPDYERRVDYYEGRHKLPYAPPGVSEEYLELRQQAPANWCAMAINAPLQRLRGEGIRTNTTGEVDSALWRDAWQANHLDARQRIVYVDMFMHGQAVVSVWPDEDTGGVRIRPESWRTTYVNVDPEDAFAHDWALRSYVVKGVTVEGPLPGASTTTADLYVATVFDADSWMRFEKGGDTGFADWTVVDSGAHDLGEVPFLVFTYLPNAEGDGQSALDPLIPAQDAINTIRFDTLLAMQFAAYRQRVFTGYDPVVRDENGDPVFLKDSDGNPVIDPGTGLPKPVLNSPGRLGVDRALVFPGADTKVFDLNESNLSNYITVLGEFLSDFFAIAQVPPQYLLNRMSNLSGDALAGAESTLASLVRDLQTAAGEAWEAVLRLANRVLGTSADDVSSELIWGDGEARSFAQVVDAIVKLATTGFPKRAQWELIPGATLQKVDRWMQLAEEEQAGSLTSLLGLQAAQGAVPGATPAGVDEGATGVVADTANDLLAQAGTLPASGS